MEYNLAGLRKRLIIDKLDDEEYEPDVADNFLNDSIRDISNTLSLPYQEKIFSGDLNQGITLFSLPKDLALAQAHVVTSPVDGSQKDLERCYLDFRTFNKRFPTPAQNKPSEVVAWTSYAGNMLLSAPTDRDYVMDIFYIKKPTLLKEGTDVPDLPEEFAELILLGGLMRVQRRNEDYDLAEATQREYEKQMDNLAARYGLRKADATIRMKTPLTVGRRGW